jgi:hypothetical protein
VLGCWGRCGEFGPSGGTVVSAAWGVGWELGVTGVSGGPVDALSAVADQRGCWTGSEGASSQRAMQRHRASLLGLDGRSGVTRGHDADW